MSQVIKDVIRVAFEENSVKQLVEQLLKQDFNDWQLFALIACSFGSLHWVTFASDKGNIDWNVILTKAAAFGRNAIIDFAVEKNPSCDLESALYEASAEGQRDTTIHLMKNYEITIDIGTSFVNCILGGLDDNAMSIYDMYIKSKPIERKRKIWEYVAEMAIEYDILHWVFFILGTGEFTDFDFMMQHAGKHKRGNIITLCNIWKGKPSYDDTLAATSTSIRYLAEGSPEERQYSWNDLMPRIIEWNTKIWFYFIVGTGDSLDWNKAFVQSCKYDRQIFMNICLIHGANSWNDAMVEVIPKKDMNLIEFLISKGANDWDRFLPATKDPFLRTFFEEKKQKMP
jgi:hypothetical protein